jgi:hypothetical protein
MRARWLLPVLLAPLAAAAPRGARVFVTCE